MKHKNLHRKPGYLAIAFLSCLTFILGGNKISYADNADILYIDDVGDNTVKTFNAANGQYLETLVKEGGLKGPNGLIVNGGSLIVVNQNVETPKRGEIFSYAAATGEFQGAVVSNENPDAPVAPRGIVLKDVNNDPLLFVADLEGELVPNGQLVAYRYSHGALVTQLTPLLPELNNQFHPRGIVVGPDGYLYFSVRNIPEPCGGSVLKSKLDFTEVSVLVTNSVSCDNNGQDDPNGKDLHRPEGLVFSPDGNYLYVTSFRKDEYDTDKLLIFKTNINTDEKVEKVGQIELDEASKPNEVPKPRAYAQAILFGPDGKLYVPINNTGEVRRCDTSNLTCSQWIAPGILKNPNYLTFGKTDPATLEYKP